MTLNNRDMLFCDLIDALRPNIENAVTDLFANAEKNQVRQGDFLISLLSARLEKREKQKLPLIGGDNAFATFATADEFMKPYTTGCFEDVKFTDDFFKNHQTTQICYAELEQVINHQMIIYNKIWESQYFCQLVLQLNTLSTFKGYDWEFSFSTSGTNSISDRWSNFSSSEINLKTQINKSYHREIRNGIAHSLYYFLEDRINFLNDIAGHNYNQLNFDDWFVRFHTSWLLYDLTFLKRQEHLVAIWDKARKEMKPVPVSLNFGKKDYRSDALTPTDHREFWGILSNTNPSQPTA